jgi:hypothetical protein
MFTNTKDLKGLVIRAKDGELGTVKEVYFDELSWAVRYLTVETGGWLEGREVLISPMAVVGADWQSKRLDVALTQKQVENSPDVDTHKPVSRQQEAAYLSYYGYPYYWEGPYLWGSGYYPLGAEAPAFSGVVADRIRTESVDSHLRSSEVTTGYHIDALDGEIGHVDRFIIDDEAWAIRYLEVATQNWWPGKKVLLPPAWVQRMDWEQSKVHVGVTRKAIESCEEYIDGTPITREYENRLYLHYGRPPYWINLPEHEKALAGAGASR